MEERENELEVGEEEVVSDEDEVTTIEAMVAICAANIKLIR